MKEFLELALHHFRDFNFTQGFPANIGGLLVGFQKRDAWWTILEMFLKGGGGFGIQVAFQVVVQQVNTFFTTNHFFFPWVLNSSK